MGKTTPKGSYLPREGRSPVDTFTRGGAAVSRRAVLAAGGALGVGALLAGCQPESGAASSSASQRSSTTPRMSSTAPASTTAAVEPFTITAKMLAAFDSEVGKAMKTFGMVGAAVAVFQGQGIAYNKGFGTRDVKTGAAVTARTRFRIGSNTKSMTSLLMAKYVDDGLCTWNTRCIDLWPQFVGPTPALTQSLTLGRLLGMGSGIAEPETIEFFAAAGGVAAEEVLRTIPYLEVIAGDNVKYSYNNTLVAAAPYVVTLAHGAHPADLENRYATDLAKNVFAPIGMVDAVVAADPRPFGSDYATGYTKDLAGTLTRTPFVSINGYGPAGSVLASSTDMIRYLITQSHAGVAPGGVVVASQQNVLRTHQAGVVVPPNATNALPDLLLGDTATTNYDLGWFDEVFKDGRRMLWHAGGIDGFGSLMGFFPKEQVGFVFLTNLEPEIGGLFNFSLQASLLDLLFGLNSTIPATLAAAAPSISAAKSAAVASTHSVDPTAVTPYLGLYTAGFSLRLDGAELVLQHDIRSAPVRAVKGSDYLIVGGPGAISGKKVVLSTGPTAGARTMTIDGYEPFQWLSGD